jgi:hypothetical protein
MVFNINAYNKNGAFQTGKGEVVHIWSAHHVEATGVTLRRSELVADGLLPSATLSGTNSITIKGVTYTADAAYDQALLAQVNLDNLVAAFARFGNPVYVNVSAGIATTASPTADTAGVLVGGADLLGTELVEANGLVWEVELAFEQKGLFVTGAKGDVTIGTGDHYGSSVADVHAVLEGTVMYVTGLLANGGDLENMVDADAAAAFVDGTNYVTEVAGAFAGAQGDEVSVVSAGNAAQATSQTVVVEVQVAPNLQS